MLLISLKLKIYIYVYIGLVLARTPISSFFIKIKEDVNIFYFLKILFIKL